MRDFTDLLYARPSFLEGAARVMDLSGALSTYNTSPSGAEADMRALRADWFAVGQDMQRAVEHLRRQLDSGDR